MFGKYTYLILDLFTILPVLILSFDKWVKFYKNWMPALLATIPAGVLFIIWDVKFVELNVWQFNPEYILGWHILELPIEEWLFFLVVPIVCLFIYESITFHFKILHSKFNLTFFYLIVIALCLLMLMRFSGTYTVVNAIVAMAAALLMLVFIPKKELNLFAYMYLIHLLPFSLVNGVLTGEPVLIYNNAENMGIRFFTIPLEDFIYSFSLLSLNFLVYTKLKKKLKESNADTTLHG